MARVLDANLPMYNTVTSGCANIHLADSITGDGHKLLNVPYDCGFFFSRSAQIGYEVFQNQGAAYLSTSDNTIISPMQIGIENSRRFRALPVYATLLASGKAGYRNMLERQIDLARRVASYISTTNPHYDLLPVGNTIDNIFMIVMFKARDADLNKVLVRRINATKRIYVSGTAWDGEPACRIAVSNWQVDPERDFDIIAAVLEEVCTAHTSGLPVA
jgi:glutamate/tyrosine decarboxylase-like PLP-dependent enzyme